MNHFAKNLITKGWLNISALTKGFILPFFRYTIYKKGGGAYDGSGYYELQRDLAIAKNKKEEIEGIKVYVDWNKHVHKYGKEIYAELIIKKIEAELLKQTKEKYKITVEIIQPEENRHNTLTVTKVQD